MDKTYKLYVVTKVIKIVIEHHIIVVKIHDVLNNINIILFELIIKINIVHLVYVFIKNIHFVYVFIKKINSIFILLFHLFHFFYF